MQKTYCDRCGKEICYYPRQQVIFPKYNINYATYGIGYQPNHFDLCSDCKIEFNNWVEKWLKEKRNDD